MRMRALGEGLFPSLIPASRALVFLALGLSLGLCACSEKTLSLIAFGDTGTGGEGQLKVAAAAKTACDQKACELALLLGDNFYPAGVESVSDPQWQEKFEDPYRQLRLPFYPVLGNHDHGQLASDFARARVQVDYSAAQPSPPEVLDGPEWSMPNAHHSMLVGDVGLIFLDTNALFWDSVENGDQEAWIDGALDGLSEAKVIVAVGHHPIHSNGPHGDAGHYDQISGVAPFDGQRILDFFERHLCGRVDLYLSGHDHSRQWLRDPFCGAALIVSGAGGQTPTELSPDRNPPRFQSASLGLLALQITGRVIEGQFIDEDGLEDFSYRLEVSPR